MDKSESFTLRSDEPVPGFSSAWPALELEWGRKWGPTSGGSRSANGLMFGLPPGSDLNQPRGPVTSLKEEPLGARWMQQPDQTKWVKNIYTKIHRKRVARLEIGKYRLGAIWVKRSCDKICENMWKWYSALLWCRNKARDVKKLFQGDQNNLVEFNRNKKKWKKLTKRNLIFLWFFVLHVATN